MRIKALNNIFRGAAMIILVIEYSIDYSGIYLSNWIKSILPTLTFFSIN